MLSRFRYLLLTVLLSIYPVRAGSILFVGGNTGDANDHLFTYNGSTLANTSERPGNAMGNPGQITIGLDGNVYIADQDPFNGPGVDIFNGATGQFVGQYIASSFANGLSFSPTGLAWGPDGKLYIGDAGSDTVSSFDGTSVSPVITSIAGLSAPEGMAFGPGGFLYIANANSGVISRWDGSTLIASFTSVVDSGGGFSDVAIGIDGNLYVTDTTNGVIQVFRSSDGSYIGHFGNTGSVLVQPIGLAFAPGGDLYVTDAEGIQVFDGSGDFVNQLVQFDSNPGDQNSGQFLAFATSAVPEPSAFVMSALGLVGLCVVAWRRSCGAGCQPAAG